MKPMSEQEDVHPQNEDETIEIQAPGLDLLIDEHEEEADKHDGGTRPLVDTRKASN